MSDDLKEHAAELRRLAAQKAATNTEQGSGSENLDDLIDLRVKERTSQPVPAARPPAPAAPTLAPTKPAAHKPKPAARKPPRTTSVPQLAVNVDADLHARSTHAAEQANVSYAEYIRQVIEQYAHTLKPRKPSIRRTGSARGAVRITVRITQQHSDLIDKTTKETERPKTSMINKCLHNALADNFVPTIETDDY